MTPDDHQGSHPQALSRSVSASAEAQHRLDTSPRPHPPHPPTPPTQNGAGVGGMSTGRARLPELLRRPRPGTPELFLTGWRVPGRNDRFTCAEAKQTGYGGHWLPVTVHRPSVTLASGCSKPAPPVELAPTGAIRRNAEDWVCLRPNCRCPGQRSFEKPYPTWARRSRRSFSADSDGLKRLEYQLSA